MITAKFEPGVENTKTEDLWQYDYGQVLRIEGLELPDAVEIHFSLQKTEGEAERRVGVTKNGVTDVPIPDSMLVNGGTSEKYNIYAFIYLSNEDSGKTTHWIQTKVKPRPEPIPEKPDGENEDLFREAVQTVNDAASRAKNSEETSATNADKTAEDRQEIERLVATTANIPEDVAAVEEYKSQSQTAATNALLSEQTAKEAQIASEAARAGAETAKDQAVLYAGQTEEDKDTVEQAKAVVMQLGEEVANNKVSVEETVQNFTLLAEQKTADINNAGQAQAENIEEVGEQAVSDIETAKSQATQIIEDTGATQVQNIQEAAAAIKADREQIQQNKEDIFEIQKKKASAIQGQAAGTNIILGDSAETPFTDFYVYGHSTQESTTGAQLLDIDAMLNDCLIKNDDGTYSIYKNEASRFSKTFELELEPGTYKWSATVIDYNGTYAIPLQISYTLEDGTRSTLAANGTAVSITSKMMNLFIYQDSKNEIGTYTKFEKPMLNAGSTALPYEPYTGGQPSPNPNYPQEIVSAGDKGRIETQVTGKNLFSGFIKGIGINPDSGVETQNSSYAATDFIRFDKNKQYYLSGLENRLSSFVFAYDKNKMPIARTSGTARKEILLKPTINVFFGCVLGDIENIAYIRITQYKNSTTEGFDIDLIDDVKPQLEEGEAPTDYEPYKYQTISISNSLPGIPVTSGGNYTDENGQQWVADYRDWERGVDVQRVSKITFDGVTPNKRVHGADNTVYDEYNYAYILLSNINGLGYAKGCMANKAAYYSGSLSHIKRSSIVFSTAMSIFLNNSLTGITNEDDQTGRVNKINAVLQKWYEEGDPLIVWYILAEPIETPIPAEELAVYKALHTNYPTTVVENDEDCYMEVEYIADTKTYIDNKFKELQTALVNTQAQML